MSYGIEINTANGNTQIDSNTNGKGLIVTDSGTSSETPLIDLNEVLVFIKPSGTGNRAVTAIRTTADSNGNQKLQFKNHNYGSINCDFIIAKVSNVQTESSSGYGVQIFNTEGDLAFDSGLYTGDGGFGITDFVQAYEGSGQNSLISTSTDNYVLANSLIWVTQQGPLQGFNYVTSHTSVSYASQNGIYFFGAFKFGTAPNFQYQTIPNLGAIFIAETGSV